MSLGNKVQNLRKRHGLTQDDMAKYLEMGRSNYGHIENDRVEMNVSTLERIATKLKTTPNYLLGFSEKQDRWIEDISSSPQHEIDAIKEIWRVIKKMKEIGK